MFIKGHDSNVITGKDNLDTVKDTVDEEIWTSG